MKSVTVMRPSPSDPRGATSARWNSPPTPKFVTVSKPAAKSPAAAAAPQAQPKRSWMGPLAGLAAGFIDAIAGGGGLLTVPALLATGMPPALVLGTNKLQSSFGSFSATWFYARKGLLEWAIIWPAVICTFIGAAIGTLAVQTIDAAILERLLPFLLVAFACYFYFSPRVSDAESQRRLTPMMFALLVGGGVGFYDGFFGPGTGSFFAIGFVALAGFGMARATAHTKLLN